MMREWLDAFDSTPPPLELWNGDPGEPGAPGGVAGSTTLAQTAGSVALGETYVPVAATKSTDGVDGFLDCQLESAFDDGAYTALATRSSADRELFFSESLPAFTTGATIQFRVCCRVIAGARTVTAANIGAIASSAGILD